MQVYGHARLHTQVFFEERSFLVVFMLFDYEKFPKVENTEFMDSFAVKYKVSLPGNIFSNSDAIFEAFGKLGDLSGDDFDDFDF